MAASPSRYRRSRRCSAGFHNVVAVKSAARRAAASTSALPATVRSARAPLARTPRSSGHSRRSGPCRPDAGAGVSPAPSNSTASIAAERAHDLVGGSSGAHRDVVDRARRYREGCWPRNSPCGSCGALPSASIPKRRRAITASSPSSRADLGVGPDVERAFGLVRAGDVCAAPAARCRRLRRNRIRLRGSVKSRIT